MNCCKLLSFVRIEEKRLLDIMRSEDFRKFVQKVQKKIQS